jgi:hypothetical protein
MHMMWMPLSNEVSANFDEKAAYEWFKTVEGLPYGYHNMLFNWIDTKFDNWPPQLPSYLVPIAFAMLEHLLPDVIGSFFGEAMNMRLGTKGLNIG